MSKFLGVLSVIMVILLAMGFASANAEYRVTIDLGLFTLYQVPVTLVAFSGLFAGMVAMFLTGIHTDLKVRKILRDRFAEESRLEQTAIDHNQQDLFGGEADSGDEPKRGNTLDVGEASESEPSESEASGTDLAAAPGDTVEEPVAPSAAEAEPPLPEMEKPWDPQQNE